MKRFAFLSLALLTGFCLQPLPLFAQDQASDKKDSKDTADSAHGDKAKAEVAKPDLKGTQGGVSSLKDKSQDKSQDKVSAKDTDQQASGSQSRQGQAAPALAVKGNMANHYNGQWVAASTHSDWDVSANHNWNNHEYRYYDGGWLMIDVSSSSDSDMTGSIVIRVKQSLAQQGYYSGHMTDRIGPHTRSAISNYQSHNGLPVNGQIDAPLLASLGLQ